MSIKIKVKRVYIKPEFSDGERILVENFWPRGVRRSSVNIDTWFKNMGPSDELRKWFGHDNSKWESFVKKYRKEIDCNRGVEKLMEHIINVQTVTFVYATGDEKHNSAIILAWAIEERIKLLKFMAGRKGMQDIKEQVVE